MINKSPVNLFDGGRDEPKANRFSNSRLRNIRWSKQFPEPIKTLQSDVAQDNDTDNESTTPGTPTIDPNRYN